MNDNINDLLQPSLDSEAGRETSIYSTTTGYMSAFFGGPLAAAGIALMNSHRLKRLGTDWPLSLLALALTVGILWWEVRGGGQSWLIAHLGRRGPSLVTSFAGLIAFGVIYAVHRKYYRNMELLGLKAPSGWIPGIAAIVLGSAAWAALARVLAS
jgi:hypothetical protein